METSIKNWIRVRSKNHDSNKISKIKYETLEEIFICMIASLAFDSNYYKLPRYVNNYALCVKSELYFPLTGKKNVLSKHKACKI